MALAKDYASVMSRKGEIMKKALGMDFSAFESGSIAFDYEKMMSSTGFSMEEVERVQGLTGVGNTPLFTLRNLTALARKCAKPGYGATICVKDEMTNPSGSFKARRAACAVAFAKAHGYKGVIAATSGNYGAAVASQAAMQGLKCIIVQEAYDSREVGQPEIIEKARACEAMGAEVVQITVGPELFYESLSLLEDTDFFNGSGSRKYMSMYGRTSKMLNILPASKHWAMRLPFSAAPSLAGIPTWLCAPMPAAAWLPAPPGACGRRGPAIRRS